MAGRYVYEDGLPGRPRVPIRSDPPKDFSDVNALMLNLDVRGWYYELETRRRYEYLKKNPPFEKGHPITDPFEMDRLMCRTDIVAECKNESDLENARFNGRIVLQIDPNCPNKRLFKKIGAILDQTRKRRSRRINTKHWAEHRILMLYDLKLMGYDESKNRKQLAVWMFPGIRPESRGDKFDRAKQYLCEAISLLPALRAQSNR